MKLIVSLQGVCALQYSPDDAASKNGVTFHDIVDFIAETYKFPSKPEVPAGLVLAPALDLTFQAGEFQADKKKFAINQLNYLYGGLAVTARDTVIAEKIVRNVASAIDDQFGISIVKNIRATYYVSDLIVEFDTALEKQVSVFGKIKDVLEREIPRSGFPFDLKRIVFGASDKILVNFPSPLEVIPNQDFLIERRAGEPHSANRFYSRAPIPTGEHERVLSLIEETIRG